MRTPAFWYRPTGAAARLLTPAGALYGLAGRLRQSRTTARRAPVPVLCVGNLVAGGAGKTPVAIALAAALAGRGLVVHFLTRGHGGTERGPLAVDPARHDAAAVGDEALLLAAHAPTWVSRDRVAGAEASASASAGADVIVMDDGFQNPHLHKDLSLVVVDGAVGFGNGRLIPAGPLREPVARGLARADAVVVVGDDRTGVAALTAALAGPLPVLHADLRPAPSAMALAGRAVLAFAGIGRPEKFFATLRDLGADIVEAVPFPDHHPFAPDEIERLVDRAAARGALPVTTAKDAVRLPESARVRVRVVPVQAVWRDEPALSALLDRIAAMGVA